MTDASREPNAKAILALSRAVLDGTIPMPKGRATRSAGLLARQALESAVGQLCRSAGYDVDRATMRSRLILLRAALGDDVADRAATAWAGLSRACHQHAYELAPTTSELDYLISLVSGLLVDPDALDTTGSPT